MQTLRAVYGGVRDPKTGKQLLPGWPAGSELQLTALMSGPEPFPVATSYMRALVFGSQKGWDFKSFDYGKGVAAARAYGAKTLDVDPAALGPFFARGGKLMLSHGWTDGLIPANNTVAFYGTLSKSIPAKQAQNQLRLFMVPGMNHCSGGEGSSAIDTLAAVEGWATSGMAPDRLIAARNPGPPGTPGPQPTPMTRPLCPYPAVARYKGEGATDKAENFACTAPPSNRG